jgi:hypothetical protein
MNADPLQHNALQGWNSAEQKPGICVRGSGMLTPLQHNALQKSAGISAEQLLASVSEDQEC